MTQLPRHPRAIGTQMKPTVEAYTFVLPWYEKDDFQLLWELASDRDEIPADYDVWHAAALRVLREWLARGRALQIVTVKPNEFLAWLNDRGLPNTAATRLKYVEERACGVPPANCSQTLASNLAQPLPREGSEQLPG